jgi:hypothetical protein
MWCGKSVAIEARYAEQSTELLPQQDDPKLTDYEKRYVGEIFKDSREFYKVLRVSVIIKADYEAWEVTCVKVDVNGEIPLTSLVEGSDVVLDKKLVGYGLEDSNGSKYVPIDDMITAYKKYFASLHPGHLQIKRKRGLIPKNTGPSAKRNAKKQKKQAKITKD